jgi:hypothetical protein
MKMNAPSFRLRPLFVSGTPIALEILNLETGTIGTFPIFSTTGIGEHRLSRFTDVTSALNAYNACGPVISVTGIRPNHRSTNGSMVFGPRYFVGQVMVSRWTGQIC